MLEVEIELLRADIVKLTKERDALKLENAGCLKSCETFLAQRDALDKAARLALDALEKSTPKPRKGDDDYCERGWRDQSSAIAALKAVL